VETVTVETRDTFEAACAVVVSEPEHRPIGWLEREAGEWRIALDGATGIVGRLASGRYIAAVVRVVAVAALVAACDERPVVQPVVVAAPVVAPVAPVVVVEEPEPEAWRCVRSGECEPPQEIDQ
jgi:hypothetical protein